MDNEAHGIRKFWTQEQHEVFTEAALFIYGADQSDRLLSDREVLQSLGETTAEYAEALAQSLDVSPERALLDQLFEYAIVHYEEESRRLEVDWLGKILIQNYLRQEGGE